MGLLLSPSSFGIPFLSPLAPPHWFLRLPGYLPVRWPCAGWCALKHLFVRVQEAPRQAQHLKQSALYHKQHVAGFVSFVCFPDSRAGTQLIRASLAVSYHSRYFLFLRPYIPTTFVSHFCIPPFPISVRLSHSKFVISAVCSIWGCFLLI